MMRAKILGCILIATALSLSAASAQPAQSTKKEYLSASEADKIRDAETPDERIRLFVSFAADRIVKLKYELAHPTADRRRNERLNALVNNYSSCMDDAADLVLLAIDKQQDIHLALKQFDAKGKEFLAYLTDLSKNGPELSVYKDNLDDALESTNDAMKAVEKATKEIAPPPVRRKQ
jgi:hypothetical protein